MYKLLGALLVLVGASALALPAAGAESVNSLLASGEQIVGRMHKANTNVKAIQQKVQARKKEQAALNKERAQFKKAVATYNENGKKLKEKSNDYNLNCTGNMGSLQCPRMRERINKLRKKTNAKAQQLQAQQQAMQQKLTKFNSQGTALNQQAAAATKETAQAFNAEQAWLNKALGVTSSGQFRRQHPHYKAAGCPASGQSATNAMAMQKMSEQMLACLRTLAGGKHSD